jgi:tripeptidyl-peptidase-1
MVNSARIDAKMPTMGFLNPFIYGAGRAGLNDITAGGSVGCTGEDYYSHMPTPVVPFASWNATAGWDPVTGWGTPNFQSLMKLALSAGSAPANGTAAV